MRPDIDPSPAPDLCATVLARAFVDEPGLCWICGPGTQRKQRWFAATARAHAGVPGSRAYVVRDSGSPLGAALASPPRGGPGPNARLAWTARVAAGCGPAAVRRTLTYLAATEPEAPDGAWTLEFVGVLPGARGRGVARALIDRVVDDAAGADVRLTTAEPANVALYRHLAFEEDRRIRVAHLTVVAMRRPGG